MEKLKERNIGTGVHFIPLHKHSYYKDVSKGRNFPVADRLYKEVVSLPIYPGMSDSDVYYVIENINDILNGSN